MDTCNMNDKEHYRAYLLRLKRGRDQTDWRATLQDTRTGKELRFATERDLVRFLLRSLKKSSP